MSIRDLYEWAVENNALDLDIEIQHRDGGGYYNGVDDCDLVELATRTHSWNTEQVVLL